MPNEELKDISFNVPMLALTLMGLETKKTRDAAAITSVARYFASIGSEALSNHKKVVKEFKQNHGTEDSAPKKGKGGFDKRKLGVKVL